MPGDCGEVLGGNPGDFHSGDSSMMAVKTVFDILEKDQILPLVQEVSQYLIQRLDEVVDQFDCVIERRGLGLMQGLVLNQEAKSVVKALLNDGVIVVTAGSNVIRMLPPLIITPQHVDEFIEKLKKILKK